MKYTHLLSLTLLIALLCQCTREKKIVYNIPDNYPADKRAALLSTLDKGKKLYIANCSKCHGIFTKGEDGVPNFTNQQIDNYSAGFTHKNTKNHAALAQISPEQLNEVLLFLKYHKTNGATATVKNQPAK